jgi:hypothetical protein
MFGFRSESQVVKSVPPHAIHRVGKHLIWRVQPPMRSVVLLHIQLLISVRYEVE